MRDGYTVIRNVVPFPMVQRALRLINRSLGEGIDQADLCRRTAGDFPELATSRTITDLVNATAVSSYVETLTGLNSLVPVSRAQIALRFPVLDGDDPRLHCHLDGQWGKFEGVEAKDYGANFSVLVCVLLNDIHDLNCGNFSVVPQTHRIYEEHFRHYGIDAFSRGIRKVKVEAPVQITGTAGDVVLMHYQLAHGPAPNFSANIRYAAFFRFKNALRDSHKQQALTNIWLDFPPISNGLSKRLAPAKG